MCALSSVFSVYKGPSSPWRPFQGWSEEKYKTSSLSSEKPICTNSQSSWADGRDGGRADYSNPKHLTLVQNGCSYDNYLFRWYRDPKNYSALYHPLSCMQFIMCSKKMLSHVWSPSTDKRTESERVSDWSKATQLVGGEGGTQNWPSNSTSQRLLPYNWE